VRAAQLFAGMSGKDLALRSNAEPRPSAAEKAAEKAAAKPAAEPKRGGRGRYH
jgi:hypothetical protein